MRSKPKSLLDNVWWSWCVHGDDCIVFSLNRVIKWSLNHSAHGVVQRFSLSCSYTPWVKKGDTILLSISLLNRVADQLSSHTQLSALFVINVFTARCTLVQSAVLRSHVVCPSVCPPVRPSVTLVNCDHIGWKSSKIISPSVSLVCSLFATQTSRVYSKGNTLKFSPE